MQRLETMDRVPRSTAACLTAQALNIGYAPVTKPGAVALERGRLSHVAQNYLSAETYALANAPLIEEQAKIGFAQIRRVSFLR
ncbi:Tn3 family transposase [Microbispora sp. NEAU-D428]|uniref:Tn3 family transposase n=1 Tax=Microbispora sitophila TaxID=2771537 RepID=UPI0018695C66|nr:Tn3 family transposase [Microbispora sitophila]MBE3013101.1 Tn3 family transposase [Microbispora sitophila]